MLRLALARAVVWALALGWFAGVPAFAERPALPAFTGYVVDQARVLDADAVARITAIASRLDRAGAAQLAVATLPSLGDSTVEETAVRLFELWKLGHSKERSDGVLILYVPGPPGQRKTRVEVGYGLEGVLPDAKAGALIREHSSPFVRENRFGEAAVALATAIAQIIDATAVADVTGVTGGAAATPVATPRRAPVVATTQPPADQPRDGRRSWPWVLLSMGALFVWLFVSHMRQRVPGALHAVGGILLVGVSAYALATATGAMGWVIFVVGLLFNGLWWMTIADHRCAKCRGWAVDTREVLREATLDAEGHARVTRRCTSCLDVTVTDEVLPRKEPPAAAGSASSSDDSSWSSSSDSGSSFSGGGGGESGGGGASSSD